LVRLLRAIAEFSLKLTPLLQSSIKTQDGSDKAEVIYVNRIRED
jgi:hypothetical protein